MERGLGRTERRAVVLPSVNGSQTPTAMVASRMKIMRAACNLADERHSIPKRILRNYVRSAVRYVWDL